MHAMMSAEDGVVAVHVSDSIALAAEYFRKIVEGRPARVDPRHRSRPQAMAILVTRELPIGSHLGAPIRLRSGQIYGVFCCFNFQANAALDERDLQMMKIAADLVACQIDVDLERRRDRADKARRIQALIQSSEEPSIVYQPMFQLSDMTLVGAEALARFQDEPQRSPDKWFMEAEEVGLKTQLEIKAARSALARYRSLWKRGPLNYLGNQQFAADDNGRADAGNHRRVSGREDHSRNHRARFRRKLRRLLCAASRRCADAASRLRSTTPAPDIPA